MPKNFWLPWKAAGVVKLKSGELETVKAILSQFVPEYEIRAFGSRVHGENLKPHSDLDLVIMNATPLEPRRYAELQEAFSESDIPFKVDIVEWASISKEFQERINRHFETLNTP